MPLRALAALAAAAAVATAAPAGHAASAAALSQAAAGDVAASGTLGRTSVGALSARGGGHFMDVAGPYALPTAASLTGMSAYMRGGTAPTPLRLVVYSDQNGTPGALAAVTTETVVPVDQPAGWVDFGFATRPVLQPGSYWLGYWYGATGAYQYYDDVAGVERYSPADYSKTADPPAFQVSRTSTSAYSMYASYQAVDAAPSASAPAVDPASPPTISGSATVGATLGASTGSWSGNPTGYGYQWSRCDGGASCIPVAGATGQTYVAVADDVGSTLRVTVTATNAAGSGTADSAPTDVVTDGSSLAPVADSASPPAISGTAKQGETLTVSNGGWSGSPTSFAYQWQRCDTGGTGCAAVDGETGQSYDVQAADVGSTLRAIVNATNADGSATATSAATATVAPAAEKPQAGQLSFARGNLPIGAYSQVVEGNGAGDLNGDGKPDIVVAGDDYLVWYENPSWTPHLIARGAYGAGAAILVRDVNGDGQPDIIVGERGAAEQEVWFENTGTGFVRHVLSTSAYCHDLFWADLDGDGRADLACDWQHGLEVVWLRHPADPTQEWPLTVVDPNRWVMGLAVADVNRDGTPDIVAGQGWYDGADQWHRYAYSNRKGPVGFADFTDGEKITLADLNGDGRIDIFATLFAEAQTGGGQVWAFLQPADPTKPWPGVEIDPGPLYGVHSQAAADFDGSGRFQVAVGGTDLSWNPSLRNPPIQLNVYTLVGDPAQVSGWQKTVVDNMSVHEMKVVDLNGDGRPDLEGEVESTDQFSPPQPGAVHWWLNQSGGSATPPSNTSTPTVFGTAKQGVTLRSAQDFWTGTTPILPSYQWYRCDASGASCTAIAGATSDTYVVGASDVGATLQLAVTGRNALGEATIRSAPTAVVQSSGPTVLGSTTAGSSFAIGGSGYIALAGPYSLAQAALLTKLTGLVQGWRTATPLRAVVYADDGGSPGAFVAASSAVTVAAGADPAWVDFAVPATPKLPAGKYWLGYWFGGSVQVGYAEAAGAGRYAGNDYSAQGTPKATLGASQSTTLRLSLYGTLTSG